MSRLLNEYLLGDMTARYVTDEKTKAAGLVLLPAGMEYDDTLIKEQQVDSLVQVKLSGDMYMGSFAQGNTLRNGGTVTALKYHRQYVEKKPETTVIITELKDDRNYLICHYLVWKEGTSYLRSYSTIENHSDKKITLEMISSFSLSEISPYLDGDSAFGIELHRLRSRWSQEGRHEAVPLEALQLESSWTLEAVRCERFGQVGSLPVNNFFPFAALEDKQNHIFWGAQLSHPASWQMEIYRRDEGVAVSGGLADREFGHWLKDLDPLETFKTPEAILTVCQTGSFDIFTARLTQAAEAAVAQVPVIEQDLPVVFNEYCTTWGNPSHQNIEKILAVIKNRGFTYFVIDCGWYKEGDIPWSISMGDYQPSKDLFPDGLLKTVDRIKAEGLKPGIWFEIENVGSESKAYHQSGHLLHRDGHVLTTHLRRFWNMRDPWVKDYLSKTVIGTLKKYGFEYMKIDYNDTIGIGCDGAESLGEGLRLNMAAAQEFFKQIRKEIPDIVLENCASGGHRLEPGFMELTSMASFSDAHECEEIPIIAANLHWAILPRQSQIWAVIRKEDSLKRIAYSVAATFLGRMCISGDVIDLSGEQWDILQKGIGFYQKISAIIKSGQSYRFGPEIESDRHPKGWQALARYGENGEAYVVIHTFDGPQPETIEIILPEERKLVIEDIYTDGSADVLLFNRTVIYNNPGTKKALALYLK